MSKNIKKLHYNFGFSMMWKIISNRRRTSEPIRCQKQCENLICKFWSKNLLLFERALKVFVRYRSCHKSLYREIEYHYNRKLKKTKMTDPIWPPKSLNLLV